MFFSSRTRNAHLPQAEAIDKLLPVELRSPAALLLIEAIDALKAPRTSIDPYQEALRTLSPEALVALARPALARADIHWQEAVGLFPTDRLTGLRMKIEHFAFGSPYSRIAKLVLSFCERLKDQEEYPLAFEASRIAAGLAAHGDSPVLRFAIALQRAELAEQRGDYACATHERLVALKGLDKLSAPDLLEGLKAAFRLHQRYLDGNEPGAADALLLQIEKLISRWHSVRLAHGQTLLYVKAQAAHDRGNSEEALATVNQALFEYEQRHSERQGARKLFALRGQVLLETGDAESAELDLRVAYQLYCIEVEAAAVRRPSRDMLDEIESVRRNLRDALSQQGKTSELLELDDEFTSSDEDGDVGV